MKKDKVREEVGNVDADGVQVSSVLDEDGRFEYPDPVPMEPPIGYKAPPDIGTLIKQMVRNELFMRAVEDQGYETFEEAEDFDIEDDPVDPLTPYEKVFEPTPARDGVGVNGGGPVKPTAEAAPVQEASKVSASDGPSLGTNIRGESVEEKGDKPLLSPNGQK